MSGFDAGEYASGRAIPLCLPDDCEWKPETNTCEKIEVDSTWELVLKSTYDRAIANALAVYEEQMQVVIPQLPLEVDDLMVAHSKANSSALELFESEVDCEHSPHDKYLAKLQVYALFS